MHLSIIVENYNNDGWQSYEIHDGNQVVLATENWQDIVNFFSFRDEDIPKPTIVMMG